MKFFKALPFSLAYVLPLATVGGFLLGGLGCFLGVFFLFVLTPMLDELLGMETWNPNAEDEQERDKNWFFDLWVWLWVPFQLSVIGWGLYSLSFESHSWLEFAGIALSTGIITGGIGITAAHELMHRQGAFDRALAEILMTSVTYSHFCVEHIYGHHRNVATPKDPATSRLGENLYMFLPRTLIGSLTSAWRLEGERCQRQGIGRFSLANRRLRYILVLGTVYGAIAAVCGPVGLAFFAIQSVVAFTLLEIINYVEHYGLQRKELEDGRYERVQPKHSWNSPHRLTSWYLFNLPRHADHHYLASRPYYNLRHMEDSPQLPAGYSSMLMLALVPPLWRRVMDPRAKAWNALQEKEQQLLKLAA